MLSEISKFRITIEIFPDTLINNTQLQCYFGYQVSAHCRRPVLWTEVARAFWHAIKRKCAVSERHFGGPLEEE